MMAGLLGDSWEDPRTMATLQLAAGLLSGKNFGQGMGAGVTGYQNTMIAAQEQARRQKLAEAQMAETAAQEQERKMRVADILRKQQQDREQETRDEQFRSLIPDPRQQALDIALGGGGGPTKQNQTNLKPVDPMRQLEYDMMRYKQIPASSFVANVTGREDKQEAARQTQAALFAQQTALQQERLREEAERQRKHDQAMAQIKASGIGGNPFFQFLPTTNGIVAGNSRTGQVAPVYLPGAPNVPLTKPADDPTRQGAIATAKEAGKAEGEQIGLLPGNKDALLSVNDAAKMLNEGIYTGAYANIQKGAAKLIPGVDKDKATRTENFISHIGNVVIPRLKEFGGNDSNEELKYLQKVMGGEITMEEGALKTVVADSERKLKARIKRLEGRVNSGQQQSANKNAKGWTLQEDANGNKAYVSPDGKQFEEIK